MKLNPWYVTGLTEGEGCFTISFNYRAKLNVKIETRPSFSISLRKDDLELIKKIYEYFRCGGIRYSRRDRTYKYETRSIKDIMKKIIPHFEKYPLKGRKKEDYRRFKWICEQIYRNYHLNRERLKEIIKEAYKMNPGGKRRYKEEELLRVLGEVKE